MTARRRSPRAQASHALTLFAQLFPGRSWQAWKACVSAILGLPVTDAQARLIQRCTARATTPRQVAREVWIICGRRAGKSQIAALLAVYLACFKTYRARPGELLTGMLLAADRRQARILKRYISGLLHAVPELAQLIAKETAESIELTNGIVIEIHTSNFRSTRGYSCIFVICDEIAFWPSDGAETDAETLNALRPTLIGTAGPLICISTPFARVGALAEAHTHHFGRTDDPVFVWVAASTVMNPTLDRRIIDQAYAADAAAASSEYGAEFRSDLASLFTRDALAACVVADLRERLPIAGGRYSAFVDPSGGSKDSFALAVAHRDADGVPTLDLVREWKAPHSPQAVTADCARELRRFHITEVTGDHYAGNYPAEEFSKHGISYHLSELTASGLYLELLPLVNSGQVRLLDHDRALGQLGALLRRAGRAGKDSVTHPPRGHDDAAVCVAGALVARAVGPVAWPASFSRCLLDVKAAESCCLLGGPMAPTWDPYCKRECPGARSAFAAHTQFLARGGDGGLEEFVERHFDNRSNPLVARWRHRRAVRAVENALGLS
jgi:hypothetical protein